MPVAADVLTAIGGALAGLNQQAQANKAEQLQALQILAQQPGATLGRAAAPVPANFLSRLVGRPYQSTTTGAPVANIGGVPITVNQAPTLADALPELFAAPPEGMQALFPLLAKLPATPQVLQGVAQTIGREQAAAETRKVREAQQAATAIERLRLRQRQEAQDVRQQQRDMQEAQRYGERISATLEGQKRRAIGDLLRANALTPEVTDAITQAPDQRTLTALVAQHGRPKFSGGVKPLDLAKMKVSIANLWTTRGEAVPPEVQAGLATATTLDELTGLAFRAPAKSTTPFQQEREQRIATTATDRRISTLRGEIRLNQNAILRMQQGDPLQNIPALAALQDPQEKARRLQAIQDYEANIAAAKKDLELLLQAPARGSASPTPTVAPVAPAAPPQAQGATKQPVRILSITKE